MYPTVAIAIGPIGWSRLGLSWGPLAGASRQAEYAAGAVSSATKQTVEASTSTGGRETAPIRIQLQGEIVSGWHIMRPLFLNLEQEEDGSLLVSDDVFLMYGQGESIREAKDDYASALTELYRILDRDAADDPYSKEDLEHLRLYLQPPNPPIAPTHDSQEY